MIYIYSKEITPQILYIYWNAHFQHPTMHHRVHTLCTPQYLGSHTRHLGSRSYLLALGNASAQPIQQNKNWK
jgi:hypothetical protein